MLCKDKLVNRLAFLALWLLVFSIPFANMFVFEWGATITRVIGMTAFSIGALAVVATGKIRRLKASHFIIAAFVAWAIASYFWSLAPSLTLQRIWTCVQLFAMVWVIWQFSPRKSQVRDLMQAYVLGAYISIGAIVANYLSGQQTHYFLRYVAAGFDPNDLGLILALGIPMSWYLSLTKRGTVVWVNRLYIPLALIAILLTASRTAFAAALLALLIVPWTLGRLSQRGKVALAFTIVLSIFLVYFFVPWSSWERITTIPTAITQGGVGMRMNIWEAGLKVFSTRPVLGVGSGAFPPAVEPILGKQWVAHNTFLSILAENGIIGFILLGLIGSSSLSLIFRMPQLERRTWLILLGVWTVGVFFLTWDHEQTTWLLLGLLVASAYAIDGKTAESMPLELAPMAPLSRPHKEKHKHTLSKLWNY